MLNCRLCWTQYEHHAIYHCLAQEHCWETPQSLQTPTPKELSRKVFLAHLGVKIFAGRVRLPAGAVGVHVSRAHKPGVSRGSHVTIRRQRGPLVAVCGSQQQ